MLEQNPGTDWRSLVGVVDVAPDRGGATEDSAAGTGNAAETPSDDGDLAHFQL